MMINLPILLLVAAVAKAQPYVPQDTPEVAAAKAAHLAELAKAGLAAGVLFYPRGYVSFGVPVVNPDGFIADTPEVAAAKAAHLAAVDAARAAASAQAPATNSYYYNSYRYPGQIYRYAAPKPTYYYYSSSTPNANPAYAATYAAAPAAAPAATTAAAPVVITPDGFVADTPEVYAAKMAHFKAHVDRIMGIA